MSHRSGRAQFQLFASFLCLSLLAACGSSGGKAPSDGGAGAGGHATAGAGGASTAGAGGAATAGVGGGTAGTTSGTAGTIGSAGAGSDASAGADASIVDGSAGADATVTDGGAGADGSHADGAAGADGSTTDAISDVAVSDAGTCPMIANAATTITDTFVTTTVPVGTGGAISDGTYTITAITGYAGTDTTAKMHTYTFKITGTVVAITGHDNTAADSSAGFTLTANATTGAASIIGFCPPSNVGSNLGNLDSYTATATVIHFYSSSHRNEVILTKQ
jgi:hypothetical protein